MEASEWEKVAHTHTYTWKKSHKIVTILMVGSKKHIISYKFGKNN